MSLLTRARTADLGSVCSGTLNPNPCVEGKTIEIFGHCRPFLIIQQHAALLVKLRQKMTDRHIKHMRLKLILKSIISLEDLINVSTLAGALY